MGGSSKQPEPHLDPPLFFDYLINTNVCIEQGDLGLLDYVSKGKKGYHLNLYNKHKVLELCHFPFKCFHSGFILWQTVKTWVKCCIWQHFIRVCTVCKKKKKNIFSERNTFLFTVNSTVLPAKSDSYFMFYLQSY